MNHIGGMEVLGKSLAMSCTNEPSSLKTLLLNLQNEKLVCLVQVREILSVIFSLFPSSQDTAFFTPYVTWKDSENCPSSFRHSIMEGQMVFSNFRRTTKLDIKFRSIEVFANKIYILASMCSTAYLRQKKSSFSKSPKVPPRVLRLNISLIC